MGQQIFYMLTDTNVEIPEDIVHFQEFESMVIPIPVEEFDDIQEYFQDITNLSQIHWKLLSKVEFHKADENFWDKDLAKLLKWFYTLKSKTFAINGYREILDIEQDIGEPILFFNSSRVKTVETFNQLTNNLFIENLIIQNEQKYWDYWSAEDVYFNRNVLEEIEQAAQTWEAATLKQSSINNDDDEKENESSNIKKRWWEFWK